jgi:NitT/TauT family transport system ATP-binding protein
LDEPFVGLDPVVKEALAGRIFSVARSKETSILFITHDLADAIFYSDRVIVLGSGAPARVVDEIDPSKDGALKAIRQALGAHS